MERNELTLEQEMRRVWDVEQVKQLMHKRVFLQTWDRRQEELDTLWVTEPERKKTASYGSNWGYYVGMEAIRGYYVDAHQTRLEEQRAANGAEELNLGNMYAHPLTTGLVEVARDGQTAKGLWMSTGAILMLHDEGAEEGRSFTWDSGKYAVDFIKTGKGWRIWHLHVCDMWRADFDRDPVANAAPLDRGTTQAMIDEWNARAAAGETVMPHGMPVIPDGPTTFHYAYASDSVAPREPRPPVPYRTFSETFSY